jgi:hypothetical protein
MRDYRKANGKEQSAKSGGPVDDLLWDCDEESRKITNFSRTL